MQNFNYEQKVWGQTSVSLRPWYIQALKLRYLLADLDGIKGHILEVGCGAGNMLQALEKERPELSLTGIDISQKSLNIAKKISPKITFKKASIYVLPFPDNSFDAVIGFDVLEHLHNPSMALGEIRRVLKKDGVLHIFSPLDKQPGTLHSLMYAFGWKAKDMQTGHVQWFSHKSFRQLLISCGFLIVHVRFSFHAILGISDVLYYSFLNIFHKKPHTTLEEQLQKRSVSYVFFNLIYRTVVTIGTIESLLLRRIPAEGGHYMAIKK